MNIKTALISVAWAFTVSSIILIAFYENPSVPWAHNILILLTGILCGILIVDLKDVILGFFIVFPLSLLMTTFFLAVLPAVTGKLQSGFMAIDILASYAIGLVLKSTFPVTWILCLMSGIFGCAIGERIEPLEEDV
jgi:hypothetical protein